MPDSAADFLSVSRPLIVLGGPTGIGKTRTAIHLAQHLAPLIAAEIVGADSRQIYKYMDIGTAKPTPEERATVPHHLIDLVTPDQVLPMSEYQRHAYHAIDSLHAQRKLPIFTGGTGQYLIAVLEGWQAPEVPPNAALRAQLESEAAAHGAPYLYARLQTLDPAGAALMDQYNARRIIRALEVCLITGQPFSAQRRKAPPPYQVWRFAMTTDRDTLYTRLDARIDSMLTHGLLDEVIGLRARGYDWKLPAMTSLGYDQLGVYLRGKSTLDQAITQIRADTRVFVRRQYNWLRKSLDPVWCDLPTPDDTAQFILKHVLTHPPNTPANASTD